MATRSSPFRPGSRAVREHDRHLRHRERLRDAGPCAVRQVDQHALGVACGHERAAEIAQAAVRGRLGLEVADEAIKVVSKTSVEGYAGFQRLGSAISCRSPFAATGGFRLTAAGRPPPSNVSCCPELPLAASVNRSRLHFGSRRSIECPLARAANWRSRPNGPRRDYFGRMPAPLASCRSLSSSQNRCSATVVIRKSLRQPGRRTAAFKARDLAHDPKRASDRRYSCPQSSHCLVWSLPQPSHHRRQLLHRLQRARDLVQQANGSKLNAGSSG